jgi:hypothetical protein
MVCVDARVRLGASDSHDSDSSTALAAVLPATPHSRICIDMLTRTDAGAASGACADTPLSPCAAQMVVLRQFPRDLHRRTVCNSSTTRQSTRNYIPGFPHQSRAPCRKTAKREVGACANMGECEGTDVVAEFTRSIDLCDTSPVRMHSADLEALDADTQVEADQAPPLPPKVRYCTNCIAET